LPPLGTPGCVGRRNCNVNLDDLSWDRPDLNREPQQALVIARNLQVDETKKKKKARLRSYVCTVWWELME
jgi:hypothetical protein